MTVRLYRVTVPYILSVSYTMKVELHQIVTKINIRGFHFFNLEWGKHLKYLQGTKEL